MKALLQFTRFISSLRNISGLNFSPMKATIALLLLTLCGCGNFTPQPVHAAGTPNSAFKGRYIFKSSGYFYIAGDRVPFTESGVITAQGDGTYDLRSYANVLRGDGNPGNAIHSNGTYTLDESMTGTAQQIDVSCNCVVDNIYLIVSADGSYATMESKDKDFTWVADLKRD